MAQTKEAELVRCARTVAKLQNQLRRLRREIKRVTADLRLERKHLKALAAAGDHQPDVAPMRLFGGAVGLRAEGPAKAPSAPLGTPLGIGEGEPDPETVAAYEAAAGILTARRRKGGR